MSTGSMKIREKHQLYLQFKKQNKKAFKWIFVLL